ncbi:MAG: amidohydrolase family protein [Acidobacteria bacterium]|nr:amidohydrolase family protein [Acidobacteriota bacterium]
MSALRFTLLLVFCTTLSLAQSVSVEELLAPRYADMIFYNGPVLTVDDQFSIAEAVAIRDGKILAVGPSNTILRLAGPKTVTVDLERTKAVMPGVINTHSHPQRYAASHYWNYIHPDQQELLRADILYSGFQKKDEVLSRVKQIVQRSTHPGRQWIRINWIVSEDDPKNALLLEPRADQIFFEMTKEDLDSVSPDKPLLIRRDIYDPAEPSGQALVNSKGLAVFLKAYGNLLRLPDESGHLAGHFYEMLYDEVLPHLPRETLARLYKREFLEWFAPVGITTVASRLKAYHISAYSLLDRMGELPLRMAYAHEIGRENPFFERDVNRGLGGIQGYGTEKLWMVGISGVQPDRSPNSGLCSVFPKIKIRPGDPFPEGFCRWDQPGNVGRPTALAASRLGLRLGGTHTQGDKGYEMMLDAVLEGAGDMASARKLRPILEHGTLANPNVIRKAQEMNAIWSTQPADIRDGRHELVEELYGKEVARMFMPTRTFLEAGVTVSWESGGTDGFDNPDSKRRPMVGMEIFVARKNSSGQVRGANERIDRKTALRILTRGGAAYVLREKELGSLEAEKWADLVVLDKNPLDPSIPDDKLSEIQVLMTVVGGRVVYDRATFVPPREDVRLAKDGMAIIDNETE